MKITKFLALTLVTLISGVALAQQPASANLSQTQALGDEILSLLQNKLAAGPIACKDSLNQAMNLTLRPNNVKVAVFNYNDKNANTQGITMSQNMSFGTSRDVNITIDTSNPAAQTIVSTATYRSNQETQIEGTAADGTVLTPQDGDRKKTLTLNVSVDQNGGLVLGAISLEEVTYYQQVDQENNNTTVVAGSPATYVYTCP